MPRELEPGMRHFQDYYQSKYNHRLLKWCYSLGSATVGAKFPGRNYDFMLGSIQMSLVMLFNNKALQGYQLTIKEIKELMKIDDETCAKNVKSLMFKGYNLLEVRNDPTAGKQTPT